MGNKIQPFPSLRCIAGITVFSSLLSKENKISALANLGYFQVKKMPGRVTKDIHCKSLLCNRTAKLELDQHLAKVCAGKKGKKENGNAMALSHSFNGSSLLFVWQ